mmetsp:Transcript_4515/g.9482  ORF Transcript_4515/g.9482 Transcript_4515/m.9482 type:complete len:97 (+) Transcript_4515:433-723(+)
MPVLHRPQLRRQQPLVVIIRCFSITGGAGNAIAPISLAEPSRTEQISGARRGREGCSLVPYAAKHVLKVAKLVKHVVIGLRILLYVNVYLASSIII